MILKPNDNPKKPNSHKITNLIMKIIWLYMLIWYGMFHPKGCSNACRTTKKSRKPWK